MQLKLLNGNCREKKINVNAVATLLWCWLSSSFPLSRITQKIYNDKNCCIVNWLQKPIHFIRLNKVSSVLSATHLYHPFNGHFIVWLPLWVHIHQVRCFFHSFCCIPYNPKGFPPYKISSKNAKGCNLGNWIKPVALLCVKQKKNS